MKKSILTTVLWVCFVAQNIPAWAADPQGPKVVVSIKPLHSLVAGVMAGVTEPLLLIPGGGSPHGNTLRPSEARMLADAQLIVWVGPRLEGFLEKPLTTLGNKARQLELAAELESELLPVRAGGAWDSHAHAHDDHTAGHAGHEEDVQNKEHDHKKMKEQDHEQHGELNQHLWLDPLLAKQIVAKTAATLSEIDPVHSQQFESNAVRLYERLENLHAQLQTRLAPIREVPYIVFHDAYQYFEAAYGLNAVGSITLSAERKPGARRIAEIREKIREQDARCVFSEPQFEPRLVTTVIEGTSARTGVLDPLGADLQSGPESYFQLMNALADNLLAGLQ